MAARDLFESFTASLPDRDREMLRELIAVRSADMLSARSEDARVRVAEEFIREAKGEIRAQRK
jgi:hypothetical protein